MLTTQQVYILACMIDEFARNNPAVRIEILGMCQRSGSLYAKQVARARLNLSSTGATEDGNSPQGLKDVLQVLQNRVSQFFYIEFSFNDGTLPYDCAMTLNLDQTVAFDMPKLENEYTGAIRDLYSRVERALQHTMLTTQPVYNLAYMIDEFARNNPKVRVEIEGMCKGSGSLYAKRVAEARLNLFSTYATEDGTPTQGLEDVLRVLQNRVSQFFKIAFSFSDGASQHDCTITLNRDQTVAFDMPELENKYTGAIRDLYSRVEGALQHTNVLEFLSYP